MPMAWPQFEVSTAVLSQKLLKVTFNLNIQIQHDLKCCLHDHFIFVFAWISFLFLFCVIFRNTLRSFET